MGRNPQKDITPWWEKHIKRNEEIIKKLRKEIEKSKSKEDTGPHLSQGNNDFPQNNAYVEPWESMGR